MGFLSGSINLMTPHISLLQALDTAAWPPRPRPSLPLAFSRSLGLCLFLSRFLCLDLPHLVRKRNAHTKINLFSLTMSFLYSSSFSISFPSGFIMVLLRLLSLSLSTRPAPTPTPRGQHPSAEMTSCRGQMSSRRHLRRHARQPFLSCSNYKDEFACTFKIWDSISISLHLAFFFSFFTFFS